MPKVVITHNVADMAKWLGFKSERADAIGALGGSNVVDHVAQDGTNTVAIAAEVDDVAGMMAALSSPPPEVGFPSEGNFPREAREPCATPLVSGFTGREECRSRAVTADPSAALPARLERRLASWVSHLPGPGPRRATGRSRLATLADEQGRL